MSQFDHKVSNRRKRKRETEPFVMIGSVLLNSDAYLDLNFSARSMLIEILNYYNGRNNGSIFLPKKILHNRGFSKNTATKALKELTSHGFIYMTKKGGNLNGGCSWYAITWLPIDRANGQYLDNFVPNAFDKWQPCKKNGRSKFNLVQHHKLGLLKDIQSVHKPLVDINQSVRQHKTTLISHESGLRSPIYCDL